MRNSEIARPGGVLRAVYRLSDPGEFTNAVAGATLKVDFLAPRQAVAHIERFMGENWAIDSYRAGVKARILGPLLPGQVAVCLVLRGGVTRQYGMDVEEGYLLCNPPNVPIDGYIAPGFAGVSVSIGVEVWEECRRMSGCELEEMEGFRLIPLPRKTFDELLTLYAVTRECLLGGKEACGNCGTPARMGARLAREIATAAWENVKKQREIDGSPRNRFRLARRAEAWMRERMGEPISVPEVSLALGVSRRELEYAFHSAFDEPPRAFLESLRMNAVRAALRGVDEGGSVTEIALAHGFGHLGRFSERYRALFGERPSETVRARRGCRQ